ncbi:MAG: ATP-binding protein [Clostridiales bacterium]|nr:ATP-binding protein [Clostridiales bacterium]
MGYSREIYRAAEEELSRRRNNARMQQIERRRELGEKLPGALRLEDQIANAGLRAARLVLQAGNVEKEMEALAKENLDLQKQMDRLLVQHGYPADYLALHPACPKCNDEGYCDGQRCECFEELLRQEAFHRLNELTPLEPSDFATFRLDYYPDEPGNSGVSPRRQMENIYQYCLRYADSFTRSSRSILFQGATGLGKTHLSLAIAKAAIDKGYGVVYGSVQNLMSRLEDEHFGRSGQPAKDSEQSLLSCDLLILDDLGTEFTTTFVTSCIYNIVNTRQLAGRPTIISTNLTLKELEQKYTERFASRIMGGYDRLVFLGKDVRQQAALSRRTRGN